MLLKPSIFILLVVVLLAPGPLVLAADDDGKSPSIATRPEAIPSLTTWLSDLVERFGPVDLTEKLFASTSDGGEDDPGEDDEPVENVGLVIEPSG